MEKMSKFIKKTLINIYFVVLFTLWCVAMIYTIDAVVFNCFNNNVTHSIFFFILIFHKDNIFFNIQPNFFDNLYD